MSQEEERKCANQEITQTHEENDHEYHSSPFNDKNTQGTPDPADIGGGNASPLNQTLFPTKEEF
jgi:hypothetical protein